MNTRAVPPTVALADDATTRTFTTDDGTLVTQVGEPAIVINIYNAATDDWARVLTVYASPTAARNLRDALTTALDGAQS